MNNSKLVFLGVIVLVLVRLVVPNIVPQDSAETAMELKNIYYSPIYTLLIIGLSCLGVCLAIYEYMKKLKEKEKR